MDSPMRPLFLILLLLTSACAGPAALPPPTPAEVAQRARADSLLALPADSLTVEHLRWVLRYQVEREDVERAEREELERTSHDRSVFAAVGVTFFILLLLGAAAYGYADQQGNR